MIKFIISFAKFLWEGVIKYPDKKAGISSLPFLKICQNGTIFDDSYNKTPVLYFLNREQRKYLLRINDNC